MKEIRTEIEIGAPSSRVWDVLVDFNGYSDWNPYIIKASGEAKAGQKLRIELQTPSGKERTYEPTITRVDPGRELRWVGKSFFLSGEHVFSLESMGGSRTRFVQQEFFKGVLSGFFGEDTHSDIAAGFDRMNQALKRRVEEMGK